MSPVNRQQPGLRLYRERDQLAAGDPAELLWIVHEKPVLGLAVGGKHWYKSPSSAEPIEAAERYKMPLGCPVTRESRST
jgi:hypothetical protein